MNYTPRHCSHFCALAVGVITASVQVLYSTCPINRSVNS